MNVSEYDGISQSVKDEELNELFEKFCEYAKDKLKPKDGDVSILDPEGMKKFASVYNAIQAISKGSHVKMTYGINEPFVGSGFIRIEGKNIVLKNTKVFTRAAKLASNFEVYPLVNGNVRMAFTFDGLTLR